MKEETNIYINNEYGKKNNYNAFRHDLGIKGAAIQFVELSVRYLLNHEKKLTDDKYTYELLKELGDNYNIGITDIEIGTLNTQLGLLYLSQVHQSFEIYLKKQYKFLLNNTPDGSICEKNNDSYIKWIDSNKKRLFKEADETVDDAIKICTYYWEIRNKYIHSLEEKTLKIPKLKDDSILLNDYQDVDYEDYKYYSSRSLYIAQKLSDIDGLSIEKLNSNFNIMKKKEKGLTKEDQFRKLKTRLQKFGSFEDNEINSNLEQIIEKNEYY